MLPPRRTDGSTYRIAVVCLGNICRSPIAEVVLSDRLARAGLSERVEVVSAGTGDWHVGNPMDPRAADVLSAHGYDPSRHRAKQYAPAWYDGCDLVLAMDASNHADITAMHVPDDLDASRLRMFRDFDPGADEADRDVPDPYFGGEEGFEPVLAMVERTARELVGLLPARLRED